MCVCFCIEISWVFVDAYHIISIYSPCMHDNAGKNHKKWFRCGFFRIKINGIIKLLRSFVVTNSHTSFQLSTSVYILTMLFLGLSYSSRRVRWKFILDFF